MLFVAYDFEIVFWLQFAKLLGACTSVTGLLQLPACLTLPVACFLPTKGLQPCMFMFAGLHW